MRMRIDGRELPLKNLDNARVRDLAELQRQTGWKLQELRDEVAAIEVLGFAVTIFLTMRNAGAAPSWDECLDRRFDEVDLIPDPGDLARTEGDTPDPKSTPEDSGQAAEFAD